MFFTNFDLKTNLNQTIKLLLNFCVMIFFEFFCENNFFKNCFKKSIEKFVELKFFSTFLKIFEIKLSFKIFFRKKYCFDFSKFEKKFELFNF